MTTTTCPNGHPIQAGDLHCGECGSRIDQAPQSLCVNGHPMESDSRFCGVCGAQASSGGPIPPTAITPTPPAAPATSSKKSRTIPIAIGVLVLLLLIGGGVAFLLLGGSKDSKSSNETASAPTTSAPTTTAGPTTTAVDRVKAQIVAIDGILTSSAVGRASLGSILGDVQSRSCANNPGIAQRQILNVADNRRSTINSLQKIDGSVSPELAEMKASLLRGLEASYASDVSYARAVGMMFQCGPLNPANPDMAAASVTDGEATAGKQAFVDAYNPLAAQYGLRSDWTPRDL